MAKSKGLKNFLIKKNLVTCNLSFFSLTLVHI